jgi:hypothetical protein
VGGLRSLYGIEAGLKGLTSVSAPVATMRRDDGLTICKSWSHRSGKRSSAKVKNQVLCLPSCLLKTQTVCSGRDFTRVHDRRATIAQLQRTHPYQALPRLGRAKNKFRAGPNKEPRL